jgi:agmatine deiminase
MPVAKGKPKDFCYRMPAEWEAHESIWMVWPHNEETFPEHLRQAQDTITKCIREITKPRHGNPERVDILVRNEKDQLELQAALNFWGIEQERCRAHFIATNDVWIRDFGPIFITSKQPSAPSPLAAVNFRFDGWGGKSKEYYGDSAGQDDLVATRICDAMQIARFETDFVLEGGAIDSDGEGSCLTTKNCLMTRDDRSDQAGVETVLSEMLGFEKILWLDGVQFDADDTEGHVDNLSRFVGPSKVVTVVADKKSDPWYEQLLKNEKQLQKMSDAQGRKLEVIPLKLPAPLYLHAILDGVRARRRYPASYANFIIANSVVLVPTYADGNDVLALETLSHCFPGRAIVPIDCSHYILGQGALHCSSQHQPYLMTGGQA